jgi:hypothetical protein
VTYKVLPRRPYRETDRSRELQNLPILHHPVKNRPGPVTESMMLFITRIVVYYESIKRELKIRDEVNRREVS